MNAEQVIKHYGSIEKAALALDKTSRCVSLWKAKKIPYWSQCAIAYISQGKLKVDRVKK